LLSKAIPAIGRIREDQIVKGLFPYQRNSPQQYLDLVQILDCFALQTLQTRREKVRWLSGRSECGG
jgi:hypothetical protein